MTFVLSLFGYLVSLCMVTIVVLVAVTWAFPAQNASHRRAAMEVSAQQHTTPRQSVRAVTRRLAEQVIAQQ